MLLTSLCAYACVDTFILLFNREPPRANGRAACRNVTLECGYYMCWKQPTSLVILKEI